jgi:L,D-transpeptidase catalytic domain
MNMRANRVIISGSLIVLGVAFAGSTATFWGKMFPHEQSAAQPTKDPGMSKKMGSASEKVKKSSGPTYPSFGMGATGPELLALNERLAELGYLPVKISGDATPLISLNNLNHPPSVQFEWRYQNTPAELKNEWIPDAFTEITRGAVMAVEYQYGLPIDGTVSPQVWRAILANNAKQNVYPYTYVLVTENPAPEKLQVWQAGRWVYTSICNTGVQQAPTPNGTFAIYLRYQSQTMTGTNPDGTHYRDPGVPYVNYFNGSDAIHGFNRSQYGFPQSVGCVELPVNAAQTVWSLVNYGTLVTVTGHYVSPAQVGSASSGASSASKTNGTSRTNSTSGANSTSTTHNTSGTNSISTTHSASGTNSTSATHTASGTNSTSATHSASGTSSTSKTNSASGASKTSGTSNASSSNSTSGTSNTVS